MEFLEVLNKRKTTNGPFLDRPVAKEHQRLLMEAASRAPSHFNSQPWRFVLIEDPAKREQIAEIGGRTMRQLIADGRFFERYRRYFRFSQKEMEERRDGILIDHLPSLLRPFTRQAMRPWATRLLRLLRVPEILGEDNRRLVAGSPLLLAALLDKEEYRPGELSGFYSLLALGMAIENIWLTTVELGMGIQFISTPMEVPEAWEEVKQLLEVPENLELMALYRLGYLPPEPPRPRIDWQSHQRKRLSQFVFRDSCSTPEED
ncbi:MAG: nitroreductase family protein [Meiothermus sp.]|uniref:nitroreductase family protein n=1 Tax=Meiothermus sp. TaxID=1955249 RepID=UPI0025D98805|nr:nitroreductase family protein [Meiothermus sp.]MCS7059119.1 nitroreductase family protein [Meiothermus sp.]MCS7195509.1 nitroreductase family protein [Meiothermus sp.]MCX7741592.1 nitroreductase family protein [Meiothermus sp.]MDW8090437.1 nitroreductase family protein [Meiothermus sp.]MDW8481062.1 nitroreductase family protein [Meiothermus sp.]